jgi:hypothetical protein
LVKSCVFRPLDRRQASGHTLRCVRYEPTVIYNSVSTVNIGSASVMSSVEELEKEVDR